jgi:hypothetical protein
MVFIPPKLHKRQVILGALDGFEVTERNPADANVDVASGVLNNASSGLEHVKAAQVAGPFAPTGVGQERWDLVYIDETGTAAVEAGTNVVSGSPQFTGAPGFGSGFTAPNVIPLAYVYIDESGGPVVVADDITDIRGLLSALTKGTVGELLPDNIAGPTGVLGMSWNRVPIDHRHPPNVDSANPEDVERTAQSPGITNIYARRDHVHRMEPAFLASLATPRDRGSSLFWSPRTNDPGGLNPRNWHWILHQFQGRALNDPSVWFNITVGFEETLELWPFDDGGTGNLGFNVGLGYADESNPARGATRYGWLYVYLIGNPTTGDTALVYSSVNPISGPAIGVNPVFSGYTAWRLITCIELDGDSDVNAIPACKYDNHVIKLKPTGAAGWDRFGSGDYNEDLFWGAGSATPLIDLSEHISPLAMCAFFNLYASAESPAGGQRRSRLNLYLDGTTPAAIFPDQFGDDPDQMKEVYAEANLTGEREFVQDSCWLHVSQERKMVVNHDVDDGYVAIGVHGYMEFTELPVAEWDFTL